MAVIDKDLGPVSAYAMAVMAGYTGTEEEFAASIAESGNNAMEAALQAQAAAKSAEDAAKLAEEVAQNASQVAQNASDTVKAKESAEEAKRLSEAAQKAAETAKQAAEDAQSASNKSATDAAGAKQDAETALKSAQDAAAAAAQALEDIRALYQEMQTWAQGVIQDVDDAGRVAVQSVRTAGDAQVQRVTDEGTAQTANAKAKADAAAQSASGAAQSAQQAAESAAVYDTVVADVNQLKQDVAAITPDDTTVDGKPWTSKKIVDSLCVRFEDTGNPVQCYPVENYPLGVKVSWEPVQEGSGDPSPDNIRPITGRNAVKVTRCRKNLFAEGKVYLGGLNNSYGQISIRYPVESPVHRPAWAGVGIRVAVSPNNTYTVSSDITPCKYFTVTFFKEFGSVGSKANAISFKEFINRNTATFTTPENCYCVVITSVDNVESDFTWSWWQVEHSSAATVYEPYTGSTTDIALPETVYGGTLDVGTGVLTVDYHTLILAGKENWVTPSSGDYYVWWASTTIPTSDGTNNGYCTHYPYQGNLNYKKSMHVQNNGAVVCWNMTDDYPTVGDWKAYLSAQYAAGTPVQVCYKLATPYTIQLTPQQITALSGVNTIYTDANGVIVTGAEDPKHTITELKNAIISLGGNI